MTVVVFLFIIFHICFISGESPQEQQQFVCAMVSSASNIGVVYPKWSCNNQTTICDDNETVVCKGGNITHLLFDKNLEGSLPSEIGYLNLLEKLLTNLIINIPYQMLSLPKLQQITFQNSPIIRSFPAELLSLTSLSYFNMYNNTLTGSTIPTDLNRLTLLKQIDWKYNGLVGTIPTYLGLLSNLMDLHIREYSGITGSIPVQLGNCPKLSGVSLYSVDITGSIPSELGKCSSLKKLDLKETSLIPVIPDSLQILPQLLVILPVRRSPCTPCLQIGDQCDCSLTKYCTDENCTTYFFNSPVTISGDYKIGSIHTNNTQVNLSGNIEISGSMESYVTELNLNNCDLSVGDKVNIDSSELNFYHSSINSNGTVILKNTQINIINPNPTDSYEVLITANTLSVDSVSINTSSLDPCYSYKMSVLSNELRVNFFRFCIGDEENNGTELNYTHITGIIVGVILAFIVVVIILGIIQFKIRNKLINQEIQRWQNVFSVKERV